MRALSVIICDSSQTLAQLCKQLKTGIGDVSSKSEEILKHFEAVEYMWIPAGS